MIGMSGGFETPCRHSCPDLCTVTMSSSNIHMYYMLYHKMNHILYYNQHGVENVHIKLDKRVLFCLQLCSVATFSWHNRKWTVND